MILTAPFLISARLLPALKIGAVTISLEPERQQLDVPHRCNLRFYFDGPDFTYIDTSVGVFWNTKEQDCFLVLLSFLSAAAEASPTGDNADLFPPEIMAWAAEHSDEISMLQWDLEEHPDLIKE